MYNLLTDPLIRYRDGGGRPVEASLPEVFAALVDDLVESFPALRPHQRHAWHAFLVQLGAIAMQRAERTELPSSAAEWKEIIRSLTANDWSDDEPWQLVVDDITKAAFMQPPAGSKEREQDYKSEVATPDELDIISTSKNHDVKNGILSDGDPNDWFFALINLQTMAGQIGNGHYPISRMQSGWNSRTSFTLTSSLRWGKHIARDITALLTVDFTGWPMRWDGIPLLWTERWNGSNAEALTLDKLHPYYLEVCRRRRLAIGHMGIYARVTTSKQRLATKSNLGVVGDPWQLVDKRDKKGNKALAMQKNSFTYQRIVSYLFEGGDWELPALFSAKQGDRFLVARGVKGDRGGLTEGYYERIIPLRQRVAQVFGRAGGTQEIADLARDRVKQIGTVQGILRHAIATFATANNIRRTNDVLRSRAEDKPLRKKVDEWVSRLDSIIDANFFDDLQQEFEAIQLERTDMRHAWLHKVVNDAAAILGDATNSLPCPAIHRLKAHVMAENVFWGRIRAELFENEETEGADD